MNTDDDVRWMQRRRERERRRARHAAETPEQREERRAKKREYDLRYYLEHREEKLAKVRAYRFEGWELNVPLRRLTSPSNQVCELSVGEFNLLVVFLASPGRVLDRSYLQTVGIPEGDNWYGEPRSFLLRLDGRY